MTSALREVEEGLGQGCEFPAMVDILSRDTWAVKDFTA